MPNVFIFHGFGGAPEESWFPWLKSELEKLGMQVFVPQFPNPKNPQLSEWLNFWKSYRTEFRPDSILIGHSLGCAFLLNVLEKDQAAATFLVAGFYGQTPNDFDDKLKTFAQRDFDWETIKKHCSKFQVFHSDNDPYVPLVKGQELARQLGVNLVLVPGAGHFNTAAGYTKFPLLLEKIRGIMGRGV